MANLRRVFPHALLILAVTACTQESVPVREAVAQMPGDLATGCRNCHQGALGLENVGSEALAEQIGAIVDGRAEHPVPVPALTRAEILALAADLGRSQ